MHCIYFLKNLIIQHHKRKVHMASVDELWEGMVIWPGSSRAVYGGIITSFMHLAMERKEISGLNCRWRISSVLCHARVLHGGSGGSGEGGY